MVPDYVRTVLAEIRAQGGNAPAGFKPAERFHNREQQLPLSGEYGEYDVHPRVPGTSRGKERLIIETMSGKAYYTPDHYRTFEPIEE